MTEQLARLSVTGCEGERTATSRGHSMDTHHSTRNAFQRHTELSKPVTWRHVGCRKCRRETAAVSSTRSGVKQYQVWTKAFPLTVYDLSPRLPNWKMGLRLTTTQGDHGDSAKESKNVLSTALCIRSTVKDWELLLMITTNTHVMLTEIKIWQLSTLGSATGFVTWTAC